MSTEQREMEKECYYQNSGSFVCFDDQNVSECTRQFDVGRMK